MSSDKANPISNRNAPSPTDVLPTSSPPAPPPREVPKSEWFIKSERANDGLEKKI